MTREEAEIILVRMPCVSRATIWYPRNAKPAMIDMETDDATASDLREIADILDQVGKEEKV